MVNKRRKKKIKRIIIIVSAVLAAVILCVLLGGKKKEKTTSLVVGYLPYYSADALERIDFSALTHLNIAFANPDENGKLKLEISDATLKRIIKKCHQNDVKAMLSLGGGSIASTNYNALMRDNPAGIKSFNKQIIAFCRQHDFDGVDIDFEFIESSPAWEYFEDWMLSLKKQCDQNELLLSAAVATWYSDNISEKAMDCFAYITVMAYDNDGDGKNHSSYEYAVSELAYYEKQGIEKSRLVLGVPFYGYRYTDAGFMDWGSAASYRYLLSLDRTAKQGDYLQGYAYNGPETIRKKAELSKQYGGIMIWELSQDADGKDSLLKVIKDTYY